ncbi:MAG: SpoIIE family protein phosphatase [Chlamydiales bacterium]|nr:SpoIIE family protein phosphatase [Chlamydiia bacterium]MCP5508324.1 SpoIIE family protein phosphatase [Chlamydiales bacterium]
MKIMVVDDERATESLFTQRFREEIKSGTLDFTFAFSAEEALQILKRDSDAEIVLILSDINMPGMSGLQLLKELKEENPKRAVMMVTAYGDEDNYKKAIAYKANGFINKPIDFQDLKSKLLDCLKLGAEGIQALPPLEETTEEEKAELPITGKILVVDDEPALEALIRQKFKKQIKNKEMQFVFASNGVEALEAIKKDEEIGIILTDINMPEMDGLTLLSEVKNLNRIFRSVVISAYGDMENIRTAMNLGASDFLTKPIDLTDLETTLNKIADQFRCLKKGAQAQHQIIEYHKELEIASNIQKSFIPKEFGIENHENHIELYAEMHPAKEISGDFYDFFPLKGNQLGFICADVSGKGVPAALFMVMSRTLVRSTALANPSPKECMREVSHYLCYNNESAMFVTAFYGILDPKTGVLRYCDAGHLPPYIISEDGTIKKIPKDGGIALGVIDDFDNEKSLYEERTITLKKGDTLFMYTDGVTEAMNRQSDQYPKENLEQLLRTAPHKSVEALIQHVKDDIETFAKGANQYDDITLFAIRYLGEENE